MSQLKTTVSEAMVDFKVRQAKDAEISNKQEKLKEHKVNVEFKKLEDHLSSIGKLDTVDFNKSSSCFQKTFLFKEIFLNCFNFNCI